MLSVALDPSLDSRLSIKLFRNVENVSDLRKKVMSGALRCCLINPKFVLEPFQIIVAANKALVAETRTTKSMFTEILFNLSISKNITRSLQQFGINDDCEDLLVVTLEGDSGGVSAEIRGDEVDLGLLEEIRDLNAIRKVYKVRPEEEKSSTLLDSVISRIATKDFISH